MIHVHDFRLDSDGPIPTTTGSGLADPKPWFLGGTEGIPNDEDPVVSDGLLAGPGAFPFALAGLPAVPLSEPWCVSAGVGPDLPGPGGGYEDIRPGHPPLPEGDWSAVAIFVGTQETGFGYNAVLTNETATSNTVVTIVSEPGPGVHDTLGLFDMGRRLGASDRWSFHGADGVYRVKVNGAEVVRVRDFTFDRPDSVVLTLVTHSLVRPSIRWVTVGDEQNLDGTDCLGTYVASCLEVS